MTEDNETSDELLKEIALGEDRDVAPFFVGRRAEIAAFEGAVVASKAKAQTVFRIFQGAPGCGKTSLLTHLHATAPDHRVFVPLVDDDALTSTRAFASCIDAAVASDPAAWAKALGPVLRTAGKLGNLFVPGSSSVAEAVAGSAEKIATTWNNEEAAKRLQNLELVLVCDEAQALNENHESVLRMLHKSGIQGGISSVLALAGLSHTAATLGEMEGLSARLSQNAVVNMGMLDEAECVESTRMMLARCGVGGTDDQHEEAARLVGPMAHRWPQHLACAHAALANELIRVDRNLERIDFNAVNRETTAARHTYYGKRLANHPVLQDGPFTARLVGMVHETAIALDWKLAEVCEAALQHPDTPARLQARGDAEELAKAVVAKGIVGQMGDAEPYEACIPSMATWLGEQLPMDDPARAYLIDTPDDPPQRKRGMWR